MVGKKMAVFLDDERDINFIGHKIRLQDYNWVVIRNYFDFLDFVDENLQNISLVSFDHDINSFDEGNLEWTGRDAARYLQQSCQDNDCLFPDFLVHSMNNIGKQNIISDIKNYIGKYEKRVNWNDWRYFHVGFVDGKFI